MNGTLRAPSSSHFLCFNFASTSPAFFANTSRPFAVKNRLAIPRKARRVLVSLGFEACHGESHSQAAKKAFRVSGVPKAGEIAARYRAKSITVCQARI